MANSGPNKNGSKFFITFAPCDWLDGKHVVFGTIIKGNDLLDILESIGSKDGKPQTNVAILDCGELK